VYETASISSPWLRDERVALFVVRVGAISGARQRIVKHAASVPPDRYACASQNDRQS
jgi:hypothetical protein